MGSSLKSSAQVRTRWGYCTMIKRFHKFFYSARSQLESPV